MLLVSSELLLASALFARSIKVLRWQPGAPKFREHDFPKKNSDFFLKIIGPVTTLWVLQPSQIMQMVFTESLLSRAVFATSINVLGWQPGAPKSREHDFPKKKSCFFEIHRTINTSIGSAALPNHAFGLYGSLTSQSIVQSQLKCLVGSQGPQNHGSTIFRKKKTSFFFEFHRTSDTSMGSVSL